MGVLDGIKSFSDGAFGLFAGPGGYNTLSSNNMVNDGVSFLSGIDLNAAHSRATENAPDYATAAGYPDSVQNKSMGNIADYATHHDLGTQGAGSWMGKDAVRGLGMAAELGQHLSGNRSPSNYNPAAQDLLANNAGLMGIDRNTSMNSILGPDARGGWPSLMAAAELGYVDPNTRAAVTSLHNAYAEATPGYTYGPQVNQPSPSVDTFGALNPPSVDTYGALSSLPQTDLSVGPLGGLNQVLNSGQMGSMNMSPMVNTNVNGMMVDQFNGLSVTDPSQVANQVARQAPQGGSLWSLPGQQTPQENADAQGRQQAAEAAAAASAAQAASWSASGNSGYGGNNAGGYTSSTSNTGNTGFSGGTASASDFGGGNSYSSDF